MQYLKALVIGMGVLIVLCVGLLAYGLLSKTTSKTGSNDAIKENQLTGFGEIALTGSTGCRIRQTTVDGRRLVLHLDTQGDDVNDATALQCQKAVIIDMSKGTIIGTIALQP